MFFSKKIKKIIIYINAENIFYKYVANIERIHVNFQQICRKVRIGMASYVQGNTVRKGYYENVVTKEKRLEEQRKIEHKKRIQENKKRAMAMSVKYVVFLTIAAFCSLAVCVAYLQLQSSVTSLSTKMTAMQTKLLELKEENSARDGNITNNTNLIEIKEKAMYEFGMCYPIEGQIIEYNSGRGTDVIQYHQIPENGLLTDIEN